MGAAYFYHLTRTPLEQTLPLLLSRALQNKWRVAVRGTSADRMAALDAALWLAAADGFLPHGLAGGAHDADQPILLTCAPTAANNAHCLMLIDGAVLDTGELAALERACIIFDGNDPVALAAARVQWKSVTEAEASAQYWSEESGNWQKKAER